MVSQSGVSAAISNRLIDQYDHELARRVDHEQHVGGSIAVMKTCILPEIPGFMYVICGTLPAIKETLLDNALIANVCYM